MMNIKNFIRVIMLVTIVAVSGGRLFASAKPEAEAQKSAEQWLALIDAGKYGEGWNTAAEYLKTTVSEKQFESSVSPVRKPLGDVLSRNLKSAKYTTSVPGAPDGQYVILQFNTSFANKKAAIETVTSMLEKNGTWKVSGYYIK
jgi:hypothetical protein